MTGRESLLLLTLQVAVPTEISNARQMSPEGRLLALARNGYRFSQLPDRSRFADEATAWRAYTAAADALGERPFEHTDSMLYGGEWCAASFAATARILALLAYQPGGVTFSGVHWCTRRHPWCANSRGKPAPACCTCGDSCPVALAMLTGCTAPGCQWCANGCGEDCDHPLPAIEWPDCQPPVPVGFRPDDEYGPIREEAT